MFLMSVEHDKGKMRYFGRKMKINNYVSLFLICVVAF